MKEATFTFHAMCTSLFVTLRAASRTVLLHPRSEACLRKEDLIGYIMPLEALHCGF